MSRIERKLKVVSLTLIAVLVLTAVFNVAFVGGVPSVAGATNNGSSSSANTGNTFVESNMNFDSIREQYLNYSQVQLNTASYDGDRWVIVELDGDTLYDKFGRSTRYNEFADYSASEEGRKAQANLRAEQSNFLKKLDKRGIDYSFKYSYTAITNAVAIKVNAEAYNAISDMNGVKGVYYSENYSVPKVAVTNNANVYTTGIYDSSELKDFNGESYQGEGMVVAVLDTGLDHTHEAFQSMPSVLGWDKEYVESVVAKGKLNAVGTADDFYYSDKVPFAYDYADDDANVFPSYSSHGTHVAGIVAGKSEYEVAPGETFIGVAPEAQLMICKVFTDNLDSESLGGANTMDILAALNDCTQLGVDVINMSLGSSAGFADEKSDKYLNDIYEAIRNAGISLIVAASNDYSSGFGGGNGTNLASNPDSGTVGSPSTYAAALSVASINGQKSSYISTWDEEYVAFITNSSDEYGVELEFIEQLYDIAGKEPGTDLKFRYVLISGVGRVSNYTAAIKNLLNHDNAVKAGYDGTIALVQRGDTTFAEKVQEAMNAGADACVIYNNLAGTIRMSLGEVENPIPTCSITMDAAVGFVEQTKIGRRGWGEMKINTNMVAGPFMSDFSSWGPMPNLELKPEITAHGGEITSAVPGGYDQYSGTSMASPNMAGAVAILRQYLQKEYGLEGTELNARINQVLMSTATIANNENGNPYSPRKQGAGLAGIADAIKSEGYITVLDGNDHGEVRDKTKLELFDDPQKKGIYTLNFTIHNITNTKQTYKPTVYVMTETMSSDQKTVAEKAYMLTDNCKIEYFVGSDMNSLSAHTGDVTVNGNDSLTVRVIITLDNTARQYLDSNFVNGMYVEGFVSMVATGSTEVTLGLPYLAFYGDWTAAPLFDYDIYELAESEQDTSITEDKKLKASAADTRVLGMYYNDQYILPLGQYIYNQDEEEVQIYPERDKIAVSMYDTSSARTIYELYAVYAGLLRGASYMDIVITDAVTGEIMFTQRKENISKSYAAGGSNRGSFISLEMKPSEWGLNNNATYNVSLKGEIDYGYTTDENGVEHGALAGGGRNTFDFQFTVDYEDPQILGYRIRYVPYTENKVTKYRIWMDVDVYDNQYVQTVLPCYVETSKSGQSVLRLITEYPVPVYGQKGETSTVSFEVTDIYEDYVKTGKVYLQVEDYAMNSFNCNILPGDDLFGDTVKDYPDSVDFVTGSGLVLDSETPIEDVNGPKGNMYNEYSLTIAPYTLYTLNTIISPTTALIQNLSWRGANTSIKAQHNEIFAAAKSGSAQLELIDEFDNIYAVVKVTIGSGNQNASMPAVESLKLGAVLDGSGYAQSLDAAIPVLELNPEQKDVQLTWTITPWYCDMPDVVWTSSNESIVTVDEYGKIMPIKKGTAYVTVTAVNNKLITKSVRIVVGDEFDVRNYTLYEFYGSGIVEIPSDRNIMYLDEDCFKGNTEITKVILPTTLTQIPENAFMGCINLEEIVIPGQCTTIMKHAFEGCTSLEKVTFGMFVDADHNELGDKYFGTVTVGPYAFKGCTALTTIENEKRLTTLGTGAFEGCTALRTIDLSEVRVVGTAVFKDCTKLVDITTSAATQIGEYMFVGCTNLESFDFKGSSVPAHAFEDCFKLATVNFVNSVSRIGEGAFTNTALNALTLPDGRVEIAANAFADCVNLTKVVLSANTELVMTNRSPFIGCDSFVMYELNVTSNFYSVKDGTLYSKDGKKLVSVPHSKTDISLDGVTEIGDSALAGVNISTIDVSGVSKIGDYAFANSSITSVTLPNGITAIPNGLFDGCSKLAVVSGDLSKVTSVGANAFRGCGSLALITMENLTTVGNSAFANSGLRLLPSSKIASVGVSAFEGSKLTAVDLPALTSIGSRAFASITVLREVSVGAVTEMGDSVFIGSINIRKAEFKNGTTLIGDHAFTAENGSNTAITVVLPDTVKTIGFAAFYGLMRLSTINLSGVEIIDAMAFYGTGLRTADLSNVKEIGFMAFAATSLTEVNLENAVYIGEGAFGDTETLKKASFPKAEVIGASAFTGTSLTEVTIPATMNSRTYEYDRSIFDDKFRLEEAKVSRELALGAGAFMNISGFKEFKVADGNTVFVAIDGVLYSIVENGLVLEQYPTAKAGDSYEVASGTVAIADQAFMAVNTLESVTLPYTVKSIGSFAFFASTIKNYTFNSVDAPVLLSTYESSIYNLAEGINFTQYNANFSDYALLADDFWMPLFGVEPEDYELTMTIPLNARGYDSKLWKQFFLDHVVHTESIMPEDDTYKAMEAIGLLENRLSEIATLTLEQINAKGGIGELAANARKAYNLVSDPAQIALITEEYEALIGIEKALRERKAELNAPAQVVRLERPQRPNKSVYIEGETFDPTGMVIVAIYDDGSEEVLDSSDYTITPDVLTYNMDYVYVHYQGVTLEVGVQVNRDPNRPVDPTPDDGDSNGGLDKTTTIVLAVVIPVAVLLIAGVVVLVMLKKKKEANVDDALTADADETASSDVESESDENTESDEQSAENGEIGETAESADETDISAENDQSIAESEGTESEDEAHDDSRD